MLNCRSRSNRARSTVSKATTKSRKHRAVTCPSSAATARCHYFLSQQSLYCDTYGTQIMSVASNHCCPRKLAACSELSFPTTWIEMVSLTPVSSFTARSSYASAVLKIVILSVRPSVRPSVCLSHSCFVTKQKNILPIFWYHMKEQLLYFSDTNRGLWAMSPFTWNLRLKWPTPLKTPTLTNICL